MGGNVVSISFPNMVPGERLGGTTAPAAGSMAQPRLWRNLSIDKPIIRKGSRTASPEIGSPALLVFRTTPSQSRGNWDAKPSIEWGHLVVQRRICEAGAHILKCDHQRSDEPICREAPRRAR